MPVALAATLELSPPADIFIIAEPEKSWAMRGRCTFAGKGPDFIELLTKLGFPQLDLALQLKALDFAFTKRDIYSLGLDALLKVGSRSFAIGLRVESTGPKTKSFIAVVKIPPGEALSLGEFVTAVVPQAKEEVEEKHPTEKDFALTGAGFSFSTDGTLALFADWAGDGKLNLIVNRRTPTAPTKEKTTASRFEGLLYVAQKTPLQGPLSWLHNTELKYSSTDKRPAQLHRIAPPVTGSQDTQSTDPSILVSSESVDFSAGFSVKSQLNLRKTFLAIPNQVVVGFGDTGLTIEVLDKDGNPASLPRELKGTGAKAVPIVFKVGQASALPALPPVVALTAEATDKKADALVTPSGVPQPTKAVPVVEVLDKKGDAPARSGSGSVQPALALGEQVVEYKWLDGPISLAPIINLLAAPEPGAKTSGTWRDYVGNALVIDRLGGRFESKPPALWLAADASVKVGPWLSLAVKTVRIKLVSPKLSLSDIRVDDWGLDGVAASLNIPPWVKASAAFVMKRTSQTLELWGSGELQIKDKLRIALLGLLELQKNDVGSYKPESGFGFICVNGLSIVSPPFKLTGLAGGFAYNRIMTLPERPQEVIDHPLIEFITGKSAGSGSDSDSHGDANQAKLMLARMTKTQALFRKSPGSLCIALGATFQIAEMVDCVVLLIVQYQKPDFEVALLGMATLDLKVGDKKLGFVQLALLARFSSAEGTIKILGMLTSESWLFDPKCKLRGGFALCVWYKGDHAGDFLISLGGYSPFVPKKPHYPALDRVGFSWQVSQSLALSGDAYFALDRYGIQLGCAASVKYVTERAHVEGRFQLDVLVEWSPLFYEAQLRIQVLVIARLAFTLRLSLDVDMHIWGPPFGGYVHVEVDLYLSKPSFSFQLTSTTREMALAARKRPTLEDVLAQARGSRPSLFAFSVSGEPAEAVLPAQTGNKLKFQLKKPVEPAGIAVAIESSIPLTVCGEERSSAILDIRPRKAKGVSSSVVYTLRRDNDGTQWVSAVQQSPALEALWCIPAVENEKTPWKEQERRFITGFSLTPPAPRTAVPVSLEPVKLTVALQVALPPDRNAVPELLPTPGTKAEREQSRQAAQADITRQTGREQGLKKLSEVFDLSDCRPAWSRALRAAPQRKGQP